MLVHTCARSAQNRICTCTPPVHGLHMTSLICTLANVQVLLQVGRTKMSNGACNLKIMSGSSWRARSPQTAPLHATGNDISW